MIGSPTAIIEEPITRLLFQSIITIFGTSPFGNSRVILPCNNIPIACQTKPVESGPTSKVAWVTPAVRAPRIRQQTFESAAAKTKVSYHIYTPKAYDREMGRRFPVLYWLHGSGGGLEGIAPLSGFFQEAMQSGKIPPMLIIFPNGMASSMWCDSKDGLVPMEQVVIRDLIPHIDKSFRTVTNRSGRIVEGFSMGGYGAARLGFKYPELFGTVSILAGGPLDIDFKGPRATENPGERKRILLTTFGGDLEDYRAKSPLTIAKAKANDIHGNSRVRVAVGKLDFTAELNQSFSEQMKNHGIDHAFKLVPGVGHNTIALLKGLGESNWDFYKAALGEEKK